MKEDVEMVVLSLGWVPRLSDFDFEILTFRDLSNKGGAVCTGTCGMSFLNRGIDRWKVSCGEEGLGICDAHGLIGMRIVQRRDG
jgi:hypothetical protein